MLSALAADDAAPLVDTAVQGTAPDGASTHALVLCLLGWWSLVAGEDDHAAALVSAGQRLLTRVADRSWRGFAAWLAVTVAAHTHRPTQRSVAELAYREQVVDQAALARRSAVAAERELLAR